MKFVLLLLFLPISIFCQNTIAFPDVLNFTKQTYKGGLQTWDIKQDKNGIVYFANNEGLLTFNGKYWKTYSLPNKTIVRSVEIDADGKIYIGGQDELGYFLPDKNGELQYTSLVNNLKTIDKKFGDVWDIVCVNNAVFFRSDFKIFKFSNNSIQTYNTATQWLYLGFANGKIYAQEQNTGLLVYENNIWNNCSISQLTNSTVTAILPFSNNQNIVTTLKNGVFMVYANNMATAINASFFLNHTIYAAQKVNDNHFVIATTNKGVFVCDKLGNAVQNISTTEGLQNNTVLSVNIDKVGNIWTGMNVGIDVINYNSAIKLINPLFYSTPGYAVAIHNSKLYIGTAADVYYITLQNKPDISFTQGSFNAVQGAKGQTWSLQTINNKLLLGSHEGAFDINNGIATELSNDKGYWNFVPTSATFPVPYVISGTYNGIQIFNYSNNLFAKAASIPNFKESSRYVFVDDMGNIWVSHPFHGIFKLSTSNGISNYTVSHYTQQQGLPSLINNHIFYIKNQILVATEKGIYSFNKANNKFEVNTFYSNILGNQSIRYLKEDSEGNVWFVHEKTLGVIDFTTKQHKLLYVPELHNKLLSGNEFLYSVDAKNILVAGEKGFYHINYEKYKQQKTQPQVQIRQVHVQGTYDSVLFGGYFAGVNDEQIQKHTPSIQYGWRSLHFEFSSTNVGNAANLEYSYQLEGFDYGRSSYSKNTEKEYTNLAAGTYTFKVKVKNSLGLESPIANYTFSIQPPWYKAWYMKVVYTLLFIGILYYHYRWQQKKFYLQQQKHNEEQKRQRYIHDLEISKNEAEIIALQNEKLASDIEFKNSELASTATHLVQKGELITRLKTELNHILKIADTPQAAIDIKKLIKNLGEDKSIDNEWDVFSKHFDSVHKNFLVSLKEKHPNMTPNELKLSAYLYMNLSTKEIAQLLNISVRGVEISRYRLRKKLQIPTEITLVDYMMRIGHNNAKKDGV